MSTAPTMARIIFFAAVLRVSRFINRTLIRKEFFKTSVDAEIDKVIFGGIVIALVLGVGFGLKRLYHHFKW